MCTNQWFKNVTERNETVPIHGIFSETERNETERNETENI
jgi:hypothetical protein